MSYPLCRPLRAGALELPNRVVMAPMTRSRADARGRVGDLTVEYYAQRVSAGLILSEAIYPEPMGRGYLRTPGLANPAQVAAWRRVTDAVHARGGRIVAQLMHAGRISDPLFLPGRATPVAPSAIRPHGSSYTDEGPRPHVTPRALTTAEVAEVIAGYAAATQRALDAGFDGVELHAGSGYLPMQFLSTGSNRRDDAYGGDLVRRLRFTVATLQAMAAVAGAHRVGLKLTPAMPFNDIEDDDPAATHAALVRAIAPLGLAFVEVVSYGAQDHHALLRPLFPGAYFVGGGLSRERAERLVASGAADAAVFGQAFIANPDLPLRLRDDAELAEPERATFYSPGAAGYTDYPARVPARP